MLETWHAERRKLSAERPLEFGSHTKRPKALRRQGTAAKALAADGMAPVAERLAKMASRLPTNRLGCQGADLTAARFDRVGRPR